MGADNMAASREIILPRPAGLGEKVKQTFKNIANRIGGQGVMQASGLVEAPSKPKTRTTDKSKEQAKELIGKTSSGSSKEPPKDKKPWIQRKVGKWTTGIGLGALALGGAGYAARETISNNIPAISRPAETPAETPAPFDNAKLDTEKQTLVFGKNAREATPEEIQNLINSPLPELKSEIKTPDDLPKTSIILSIDLQKAGKVEISRPPIDGYLDGKEVQTYEIIEQSIENQNTPIGIYKPNGIGNVENVEVFLRTPIKTGADVYSDLLYEKFDLGNKKYYITEIRTTSKFRVADMIKNAPEIDPNHSKVNYIQDILSGTGQKLNIKEEPILFRTGSPNTKIHSMTWYIDGSNGKPTIQEISSQEGKLLISTPH